MTRRRTATKKKPFNSEAELVAATVEWLTKSGWKVYQEVEMPDGGRCDIVATLGDDVWAIEAKMSLGLQVIEQAWRHATCASVCSVAIPEKGASEFGRVVCGKFGIGVLSVSNNQSMTRQMSRGEKRIRFRKPKLVEEQTLNKGGTQGGHWTPFKGTCAALLEFVKGNPDATLKSAVSGVKHHYASSSGAVRTLTVRFRKGAVPGLLLDEPSGKLSVAATADAKEQFWKIASGP